MSSWMNPYPLLLIMFVVAIWWIWHSGAQYPHSQQPPAFVDNIIIPIFASIIYIVLLVGSLDFGFNFEHLRPCEHEEFQVTIPSPEEVRHAISAAFYNRRAYENKKLFNKYVKKFIHGISRGNPDPKTSNIWDDILFLGLLPFWVLLNIVFLIKPSYHLASKTFDEIKLMSSGGLLLQLGASVCIFLQLCIAVKTLKIAQEAGWEEGIDERVAFVRKDIREAKEDDQGAADERLKWWVAGITRECPEWPEEEDPLLGAGAVELSSLTFEPIDENL